MRLRMLAPTCAAALALVACGSDAPTADAPTTEAAPTSPDAPTTDAPTTEAPTTEAPTPDPAPPSASDDAEGGTTVSMTDFDFGPTEVTVEVGATQVEVRPGT